MKKFKFLYFILSSLLLISCGSNKIQEPNPLTINQIKKPTCLSDFKPIEYFSYLSNEPLAQEDNGKKISILHNYYPEINPELMEDYSIVRELSYFKKAEKTWGDCLLENSTLPSDNYLTYYFDKNKPNPIAWQGNVGKVVITPSQNGKFYEMGIDNAENFAGFWAKELIVNQDTDYRLDIDNNFADVRVSIDNHIIFDEKTQHPHRLIHLPKGKYKVQIEYLSHWLTVDFAFHLLELDKFKNPENPTAKLNELKRQYPNLTAYYAGIHEPIEDVVKVNINQINNPTVIFLSSIENTIWQINSNDKQHIKAVIYGSAIDGSIVEGIDKDRLINAGESFGETINDPKVQCLCFDDGQLQCKNEKNPYHTLSALTQKYKIPIVGFSGDYSLDNIDLPTYQYQNPNYKKLALDRDNLVKKLKNSCKVYKTIPKENQLILD